MNAEIGTIQEAVNLLGNCEMTLDDMLGVIYGYHWFAAIVRARYEIHLADVTGCIDSELS